MKQSYSKWSGKDHVQLLYVLDILWRVDVHQCCLCLVQWFWLWTGSSCVHQWSMVPGALLLFPAWRLNTGYTTSPSSLWSCWGWSQRGCSSSGLTPLSPLQNGVWTAVVCMTLLWSGYLWAALFLRGVTWAVGCTLALMCIVVDIIPRIKSRWFTVRNCCIIDWCLLGWMSLQSKCLDLLIVCVHRCTSILFRDLWMR